MGKHPARIVADDAGGGVMEYVVYALVAGGVAFGTFAVTALVGLIAQGLGMLLDHRRR